MRLVSFLTHLTRYLNSRKSYACISLTRRYTMSKRHDKEVYNMQKLINILVILFIIIGMVFFGAKAISSDHHAPQETEYKNDANKEKSDKEKKKRSKLRKRKKLNLKMKKHLFMMKVFHKKQHCQRNRLKL